MVTYDAGLISVLFFVHMKKAKSSRQGFFTFSEVDNTSCHSEEDKNSNIIWRDCANVQARLVFRCIHMR